MSKAKRGYGLAMWSDVHGCYFAVMRTEVRSRAVVLRDQLAYWGWLDARIVEAPSVAHDDIVEALKTLRPPRFAAFVDPAPEGVLEDPGELVELCEAIQLEAEFQFWKAETPFAKRRGAAVDEALRWCFIHWELEARDRAAESELDRLADREGGYRPVVQ